MRLSFYCLLALSLAALPGLCSQHAFAQDSEFHLPRTEAERALYNIFRLNRADMNLYYFVLGHARYDPAKDTGYVRLFSRGLIKIWRTKEAEMLEISCAGKYREGEDCGIDADPVMCDGDNPEIFVFRTIKASKESVTIVAAWQWAVRRANQFGYFRMVKEKGHWKLDGVYCHQHNNYNMPSRP